MKIGNIDNLIIGQALMRKVQRWRRVELNRSATRKVGRMRPNQRIVKKVTNSSIKY